MSEPGFDPYAGVDVGDPYDYETVDADALAAAAAQQAAAAAAQQVSATYEPLLHSMQGQLNAMSSVAMHEAMQRRQEDQEKFGARMKEATARASEQFGGQWSQLSEAMAERMQQDPGFLPTEAFEADVDRATNALVTGARIVREDLQREAKQKSEERADEMLREMQRARSDGLRGLFGGANWKGRNW